MNTKRKHIFTLAFTLLFVSWIFMYAKPVSAAVRNCKHGDTINLNLGDTVVVNQKGISEKVLKSSYTWIKFTAKDNGILHVSAKDYCADIRLTNSKKTPISGKGESIVSDPNYLAFEMDKIDYGIKKGETYYLRLEGDPYQENNYTMSLKFTPRKITGGVKKAKAKIIKKKKWMKGLFTIGKKHTRWYKIKLTKKQKANIYMNAIGNKHIFFYIWTKKAGGVTRMIYRDNGSQKGKNKNAFNNDTKFIRSPTKLPKGTIIYIKVYTKDPMSSGRYEIKWK